MQTNKKQKVECKVEEIISEKEEITETKEQEIIEDIISEDEIATEALPEYSNCLTCNSECNMHSQLCSFCLRRGLIPE